MAAGRAAIALTLLFHVVALAGSPQDKNGKGVVTAPAIPVVEGDSLVSFVSDSQSPIFIETIRIPSNHNDKAREMIYSQILADRPNGVFHLGDMIALGFYQSTWRSADAFLKQARKDHIPLFPTLGNHELMFFPSYGIEQYYDRFPWYSKTGYAVRAGKLAVVLLNSNFDLLSGQEERMQLSWLDSTLASLESDSTVGAVIMACHHSPYTNSTIVSPSPEVRASFVPLYLRYAKCRLFLSGHCHAVEHFRQGGKDFLVIGGGGGLQQPLLIGSDVRWEDHFPQKTEKRMFHYLRCRITGQGLEVAVRMVKEDFSGFEDAYTLSFPFAQSTGR